MVITIIILYKSLVDKSFKPDIFISLLDKSINADNVKHPRYIDADIARV